MIGITKYYEAGIGHIDERNDGRFMVAFYSAGNRARNAPAFAQGVAKDLQQARFMLRRFASPIDLDAGLREMQEATR